MFSSGVGESSFFWRGTGDFFDIHFFASISWRALDFRIVFHFRLHKFTFLALFYLILKRKMQFKLQFFHSVTIFFTCSHIG